MSDRHVEMIKNDYIDSFQITLSDKNQRITIDDIVRAFFSSGPQWIKVLFNLRNKLVKNLGLKTADVVVPDELIKKNYQLEIGDQIGLFKVYSKSEKEIILGEDDKHLNFRVSILLNHRAHDPNTKVASVTTQVQFNNWLGRLYFLPVKPFHKLIVPAMMNSVIRNLKAERLID